MSSFWGPSTWNILHLIAHNIDDSFYRQHSSLVFSAFLDVFYSLPCRICLSFSKKYLKYRSNTPSDKKKLILFLFDFHNAVNLKLNKSSFSSHHLDQYFTTPSHIFIQFNHFYARFVGVRGYDFFCDMNKTNAANRIGELIRKDGFFYNNKT